MFRGAGSDTGQMIRTLRSFQSQLLNGASRRLPLQKLNEDPQSPRINASRTIATLFAVKNFRVERRAS